MTAIEQLVEVRDLSEHVEGVLLPHIPADPELVGGGVPHHRDDALQKLLQTVLLAPLGFGPQVLIAT